MLETATKLSRQYWFVREALIACSLWPTASYYLPQIWWNTLRSLLLISPDELCNFVLIILAGDWHLLLGTLIAHTDKLSLIARRYSGWRLDQPWINIFHQQNHLPACFCGKASMDQYLSMFHPRHYLCINKGMAPPRMEVLIYWQSRILDPRLHMEFGTHSVLKGPTFQRSEPTGRVPLRDECYPFLCQIET